MPDAGWIGRVLGVVLTLLLAMPAFAQSSSETAEVAVETLGAQQTIEVRVGRWDPIQETYANWDAIGGSFQISAAGTVTLPLIGTMSVSGLTPDALSMDIAQRVQDRMGLRGDVQAVVTITEYAPIYILGDVGAPGAYPHAPNMTVLQALSLAGGVDSVSPQLLRGERGARSSMGSYRVMELELLRRLATLSRLEAEEAGTDMVTPDELAATPMGAELMAQERRIMEAQSTALASSLAQIDELEALLLERISRLNTQAGLRQEQLALLDEELENASSLVERGLSTAARASNLKREVADQQVRLLEVETARLNAEQQLNETRRDRLDLTNQRNRDRVQGLQDQRAAIGELRIRMETEAALFSDSMRTGTGVVSLSAMTSAAFQITRTGPEGPQTFDVGRDDRVEGGDVLEVTLRAPTDNDKIPIRRLPEQMSGQAPQPTLETPQSVVSPDMSSKPSSDQTRKVPPS